MLADQMMVMSAQCSCEKGKCYPRTDQLGYLSRNRDMLKYLSLVQTSFTATDFGCL